MLGVDANEYDLDDLVEKVDKLYTFDELTPESLETRAQAIAKHFEVVKE